MTAGHNLDSFIRTILLGDLKRMVYDHGLHYLSFGTIAVGIEFLGACTDSDPWDARGRSKARFASGIDAYMKQVDERYATYNDPSSPAHLYKHLRCGMAHILKPQGGIGFTCRGDAQSSGLKHFDTIPGGTAIIMTPEDFYDDFEMACEILLGDLSTKAGSKFTDVYLPVQQIQVPGV